MSEIRKLKQAKRLKKILKKEGIEHHNVLAKWCDVEPQSAQNWINGQRGISIEHLIILAFNLGTSTDYLAGRYLFQTKRNKIKGYYFNCNIQKIHNLNCSIDQIRLYYDRFCRIIK